MVTPALAEIPTRQSTESKAQFRKISMIFSRSSTTASQNTAYLVLVFFKLDIWVIQLYIAMNIYLTFEQY